MKNLLAIAWVGLLSCSIWANELTGPTTTTTFNGQYKWNSDPGSPGDIEAIFNRLENGTFKVAFHFRFQGKQHVYRGVAEGSLKNGPLSGKVTNESKRRSFSFEGQMKDGRFTGVHAEINRYGKVYQTGSLTLNVKKIAS